MRAGFLTVLFGPALLVLFAARAHAAGYATDDQGVLYRVFPGTEEVEKVGRVQVPAAGGPGTSAETPTLTDIALHDEHGMYGISYTHLYQIDLRDPARSRRVGALGGSFLDTFNALAFDEQGTLWLTGSSALFRVDRGTGRATRVGAFGTDWTSDGDLAWIGGALYVTVRTNAGSLLATLDVETGRASAVGPIQTAKRVRYPSVWGLIHDGRTLWALTPSGEVLSLDPKTAIATPRFRRAVTFWGACPMIRI